jgi:hypothetical protein
MGVAFGATAFISSAIAGTLSRANTGTKKLPLCDLYPQSDSFI